MLDGLDPENHYRRDQMISVERILRLTISLTTVFIAPSAFSQQAPKIVVPLASQKATVMQRIGVTDVSIIYYRPHVKGRTIFADAPNSMAARAKGEATLDNQIQRQKGEPIVPFGHVWRTGANNATQFIVTDDVLINGQPLKAGTYSLHTIPAKDEWTIIFNNDAGQWGSFTYDSSKDALRVKAKPQMVADNQESLLFMIDPITETSAQINICWERVRVPFAVSIKDVMALTLEKVRAAVAAAQPDDWRTPYNAASFALEYKMSDEGMRWLEQSIKAKKTFYNLSANARALFAAGRKEEALAVATQAIAQGRADNVADTAGFEKLVAAWKVGAKQ
jgi:hypothetical protein